MVERIKRALELARQERESAAHGAAVAAATVAASQPEAVLVPGAGAPACPVIR